MGCGCAGSTRRATEQTSRQREAGSTTKTASADKPTGGPGEAGYYWTGRRKAKTA